MKLLLADDHVLVIDTLRAYWHGTEGGIRLIAANDLAGVIQILDKEMVDLVLLDLVMPGLSGQETCRRIASRKPDKFDDILYTATPGGAIAVSGCSLWLECSVYAEHPAGDHSVVLLKVESAEIHPQESPIIFHESMFKCLEASPAL